ncbi:hypothetical protein AVEN_211165-1 [Araneus ventricosus]|uniref:Uncharacterized protein n=1 Tax=Araneus ventricosus TaxID=182803 RepID=A0A4Y2MDD1_ARAVE|nr:hypothetical protein AVEN_211165-1 [Araneus ventricosus]
MAYTGTMTSKAKQILCDKLLQVKFDEEAKKNHPRKLPLMTTGDGRRKIIICPGATYPHYATARGRRIPGSKPDSIEDAVARYIIFGGGGQRPLSGVLRKFGERVLAQVSSSSSDRGSK